MRCVGLTTIKDTEEWAIAMKLCTETVSIWRPDYPSYKCKVCGEELLVNDGWCEIVFEEPKLYRAYTGTNVPVIFPSWLRDRLRHHSQMDHSLEFQVICEGKVPDWLLKRNVK